MQSDIQKNNVLKRVYIWLFNLESEVSHGDMTMDKARLSVFILMHIACLGVFFVGYSHFALLVTLFLYVSRMFFITAFYHRYFSHRSYKVSRPLQLLMAVAGCMAGQRGPLWWASHHRHHHSHSDTEEDSHSPNHGLLNSHMLWFLRRGNFPVLYSRVKDWTHFPELKILENIDWFPFTLLGIACYLLGDFFYLNFPQLGTDGLQLLVWGFLFQPCCYITQRIRLIHFPTNLVGVVLIPEMIVVITGYWH